MSSPRKDAPPVQPREHVHVHRHERPEVVRADESYTVREFCLRAGIGDFAFRQLRRDGLRIIEVGRKRYIRGADWLEFLNRSEDPQKNRGCARAAADPEATEEGGLDE